jgi:dynactin complex subunit
MSYPKEGDRIELEGSRGTVRYLGPLEGASGTWLGVEWDEAHRGKHHGDYLGKRYFECRSTTSGSFIRPSCKIKQGKDFVTAVRERYHSVMEIDTNQTQQTANGWKERRIISVREACVELSGRIEDIQSLCLRKFLKEKRDKTMFSSMRTYRD